MKCKICNCEFTNSIPFGDNDMCDACLKEEEKKYCKYCGHTKHDPNYDFCSWECDEAYNSEQPPTCMICGCYLPDGKTDNYICYDCENADLNKY